MIQRNRESYITKDLWYSVTFFITKQIIFIPQLVETKFAFWLIYLKGKDLRATGYNSMQEIFKCMEIGNFNLYFIQI